MLKTWGNLITEIVVIPMNVVCVTVVPKRIRSLSPRFQKNSAEKGVYSRSEMFFSPYQQP